MAGLVGAGTSPLFSSGEISTLDGLGSDLEGEGHGSLVEFTVGLLSYLKELGYSTPDDFASRFFDFAEAGGIVDDASLEAYEAVYETIATTSAAEHAKFHDDYQTYLGSRHTMVMSQEAYNRIKNHKDAQSHAEQDVERHSRQMDKLQRKLDKMREEETSKQKEAPKQFGSKKKRGDVDKKLSELSGDFKRAFEGSRHKELFEELPQIASGKRPLPDARTLDEMTSDMKRAMKEAMRSKRAMEMLSLIDDMATLLKEMKKERAKPASKEPTADDVARQIEGERQQMEEARARIERAVRQINEDIMSEVEKPAAKEHREEFSYAHNAVRTAPDVQGDIPLESSFKSLTADQREQILLYIKDNARKFKTRMTRNIRSGARVNLDMATTCKKACSTMGVPISLVFEQPKRNKAKLLMFLDVSGSCKEASEMMLVFMNAMQEVFPGGCKSYAFVNSLYDISAIFESVDAAQATSAVLSQIPTRGVYSDYHRPFSDYVAEHMNEVSKDTLVFFIGDARNNRNPTGESNIKAIARKAKRAYWLNTEAVSKWDHADSIMGIYARYMNRVAQVTTPGELIGFLTEIK